MRNGFRFPKSTIIFMALILGGVLTAIKKGEDIATSVPHDMGPVGPLHIQSVHSILLGSRSRNTRQPGLRDPTCILMPYFGRSVISGSGSTACPGTSLSFHF